MTQKCKIAFHVSRHHEVLVCKRQHMNVPAGQRLQLSDTLNANGHLVQNMALLLGSHL